MKIHTWILESVFVFAVLTASLFLKPITNVDIVCLFGVWMTFMHAQVSERMQEKQGKMIKPDVECYKWSNRYFFIKEAIWMVFFIMIQSYPALVGAVVFVAYPSWRKYYRTHLQRKPTHRIGI